MSDDLVNDDIQDTVPEESPKNNVELKATFTDMMDIVSNDVDEKLDFIQITGRTEEELYRLRRKITSAIDKAQNERLKIVQSGKDHDFKSIDNGAGGAVYLTIEELKDIQAITACLRTVRQGFGEKVFEEESVWSNKPKHGDVVLSNGKVVADNIKDPVQKLRAKFNITGEIDHRLWHSGIVIRIETPGLMPQLRLESKLLMDKVLDAADTSGISVAAATASMNIPVVDFALSQVVKSTSGSTRVEDLKNVILLTDLELLAGAAANSLYPDGYNIRRRCLSEPNGCGHEYTAKLNIRRMVVARTEKLSQGQLNLISAKKVVDIKTIREYQESMRPDVTRYVDIGSNVRVWLQVPTISEYERISIGWMERLKADAIELMTSNATEQEREAYLIRAQTMAVLMQYGHWIRGFVEVDPENPGMEPTVICARIQIDENQPLEEVLKRDKRIDSLLEDFSADEDITEKILEGVDKFIHQMTIANYVITKEKCPECGAPHPDNEKSAHPDVISINPVELFFTLLRRRILEASK